MDAPVVVVSEHPPTPELPPPEAAEVAATIAAVNGEAQAAALETGVAVGIVAGEAAALAETAQRDAMEARALLATTQAERDGLARKVAQYETAEAARLAMEAEAATASETTLVDVPPMPTTDAQDAPVKARGFLTRMFLGA